ncbi:hypothetical protein [Mesorhizobium sp. Pch-S]|uniref:hypothetical protein n=1 Tax=Mesorhizobium sp. Pch-S TaxID=2082387 RepID=UPI0010102293|nr:hypothetical protein [Mesorhizobium sp. Pch-S]QAZ45972.1 hypothetical protein C1M53_26680 [Mesorhizobium sp. Pch-S]
MTAKAKNAPKIIGFEFAPGARFQSGDHPDANEVGRHMEMLRETYRGELTPDDVLTDAANPNSPLHSFFEWDDTEAARLHRLAQARGLIRAVVAVYKQPEQPVRRMRAYVHINEPGTPHYREVGHAMSVKSTRDIVLKTAWREFQQWRQRYKDLKEFADLFEVADEIGQKLLQKQ